VTSERIEPRVGVSVIAVEKRSVDVEEDGLDPRHGLTCGRALQSTCPPETGAREEQGLLTALLMNAIDLLKQQHKKTKALLEKASEGKLDPRESKKAADELVAHMVIEEHIFYPRVRQLMKDLVGESFEEHTVARFALARALTARGEEQIKVRFTVLKELVNHHIQEEEKEMLPKVQRAIPAEELERLGERMQAMFERAVRMGFESLVTGPTRELRSPNGGINGRINGGHANGSRARGRTPSRTMRAAR